VDFPQSNKKIRNCYEVKPRPITVIHIAIYSNQTKNDSKSIYACSDDMTGGQLRDRSYGIKTGMRSLTESLC